jgi:hypothetical protein
MKKLLILIATAIAAVAISKKMKDQQAEKALWSEATDTPR